jgi:hypothetical protein
VIVFHKAQEFILDILPAGEVLCRAVDWKWVPPGFKLSRSGNRGRWGHTSIVCQSSRLCVHVLIGCAFLLTVTPVCFASVYACKDLTERPRIVRIRLAPHNLSEVPSRLSLGSRVVSDGCNNYEPRLVFVDVLQHNCLTLSDLIFNCKRPTQPKSLHYGSSIREKHAVHFCLISVGAFVLGCVVVIHVKRLRFARATVYNVSKSDWFTTREMPGFIHQKYTSPALICFGSYVDD